MRVPDARLGIRYLLFSFCVSYTIVVIRTHPVFFRVVRIRIEIAIIFRRLVSYFVFLFSSCTFLGIRGCSVVIECHVLTFSYVRICFFVLFMFCFHSAHSMIVCYYVWFVALRGRNCDTSVYFLLALSCFYASDARARLVHGIPAFLLCCACSLRARCAPG